MARSAPAVVATMVAMGRTYVILDGIQDPILGRELSRAWYEEGFHNGVDVSGQSAWLGVMKKDQTPSTPEGSEDEALSKSQMDGAASVARAFGLEIRDRPGNVYRPDNTLDELRRQITHEYKSRLATVVVFGLPAVALHYWGPMLAGNAIGPRSMAYPWLMEMLLVGWGCLAGGWPILWQGALSLARLRAGADVLTSLIVAAAFVPSALGVLSLTVIDQPWFIETPVASDVGARISAASAAKMELSGPLFYAAWYTMTLALAQRWLSHRWAHQIEGRADVMIPSFGKLVWVWLLISTVGWLLRGWRWGLATGMVLPPACGLGSINPWSPGWSVLLPVISFLAVLYFGEGVLGFSVDHTAIETAAGFGFIMTLYFAVGWRAWHRRQGRV